MEIDCLLDTQFAEEIRALLVHPPLQSVQEYFHWLLQTRQCQSVQVKPSRLHGKGVYATKGFEEGELLLKDHVLIGAQHTSSKMDCKVCSYCFRPIGSVELQIGRKLYLRLLGLSSSKKHAHQNLVPTSVNRYSFKADEDGSDIESCDDHDSMNIELPPADAIESLMNGSLTLPYSEEFTLPPIVFCPGRCEEEHYCSEQCANADWELCHSLLCTGEMSGSKNRDALSKFMEHATGTNEIFLLAAKVISSTVLSYKKLKSVDPGDNEQATRREGSSHFKISSLLEAWRPFSMGYKRRWWDCIALPEDVDIRNEKFFRMQIRELAYTSLQLLKEAIFDEDCAPLFSLEIYGHIIGMFELNNLELIVASPVEDYLMHVDNLKHTEKEEMEQTRPFLEALGDDYSFCCQGTAFYPIHSCMNHCCSPNAKAFRRHEVMGARKVSRAAQCLSFVELGWL